MPNTAKSASTSTRLRFAACSAAIATECASTGSVLGPLPVANTHTCAERFAGTSNSLTVVHYTVREVSADAVAALDRPHPLWEPPTGLDQAPYQGSDLLVDRWAT